MSKLEAEYLLDEYADYHSVAQMKISNLMPNSDLEFLWYWMNGQQSRIHYLRCDLGVNKFLLDTRPCK